MNVIMVSNSCEYRYGLGAYVNVIVASGSCSCGLKFVWMKLWCVISSPYRCGGVKCGLWIIVIYNNQFMAIIVLYKRT